MASAASRPDSPRSLQDAGQGQVGVGARGADRGEQVERRLPGRIVDAVGAGSAVGGAGRLGPLRATAVGRPAPVRRGFGCVIGSTRLFTRLFTPLFTRRASFSSQHRAGLGRPPRAQSAASIGLRPGAVSRPSRTAVVPVPTSTSVLPAPSSPGRRSVRSVCCTGPITNRPQGESVQAPGSGVRLRIVRCSAVAGCGPVEPGVGHGDLARVADPVGRLRTGLDGAVVQAVQGGQQQRAPRSPAGPAGRRRCRSPRSAR